MCILKVYSLRIIVKNEFDRIFIYTIIHYDISLISNIEGLRLYEHLRQLSYRQTDLYIYINKKEEKPELIIVLSALFGSRFSLGK